MMRRIETVSPITINIAIIVLSFIVILCFTDDAKVMEYMGNNMDSVNLKLLNYIANVWSKHRRQKKKKAHSNEWALI